MRSRKSATDRRYRRQLEQLLDLAQDASSYLRRHQQSAVRVSTALLLAASVAACSPSPGEDDDDPGVEPLEQEVRQGLPTAPGQYDVQKESLARDAQGVYFLNWLQPGGGWQQAQASLLRLVEADRLSLQVPEDGDPILHLPADTAIALVEDPQAAAVLATPAPAATAGSTTSATGYRSAGIAWFPFFIGAGFADSMASRSPAYRNPPPQPISQTGTVSGSVSSITAPSTADRVVGLSHGVSGQAGGTGRGTAATLKSGAAASGKSGGTGIGGAAGSKGTGVTSGVSGTRSGGFSGGSGGLGGSSGG